MNAAPPDPSGSPKTRRCPICGKTAVQLFRPFCSKRCVDVDLNRWLSGVYAIPAVEQDDEAEEPPAGKADGERG
jgi:endogenous inhibitor of DNA gyrase (YacG/DUF329 family)